MAERLYRHNQPQEVTDNRPASVAFDSHVQAVLNESLSGSSYEIITDDSELLESSWENFIQAYYLQSRAGEIDRDLLIDSFIGFIQRQAQEIEGIENSYLEDRDQEDIDELIRRDDLYGLYLKKAINHPLLSHEQELFLGETIQKNLEIDPHTANWAINELIMHNQKLVVYFVHNYFRGFSEIMDAIQSGNVGLHTAARKFDPDCGARFSTYAAWWIRSSIQRAATKTEDLPDDYADFTANEESFLGGHRNHTGSGVEPYLSSAEAMEYLEEHYSRLAQVLSMHYGLNGQEPMTVEEIAAQLGVSHQRIYQLEKKAIEKIRKEFNVGPRPKAKRLKFS